MAKRYVIKVTGIANENNDVRYGEVIVAYLGVGTYVTTEISDIWVEYHGFKRKHFAESWIEKLKGREVYNKYWDNHYEIIEVNI